MADKLTQAIQDFCTDDLQNKSEVYIAHLLRLLRDTSAKIQAIYTERLETRKSDNEGAQPEQDYDSILQENKLLKHQAICIICKDKPRTITFLPCGHFAYCELCAPALTNCALCGTTKRFSVVVYRV